MPGALELDQLRSRQALRIGTGEVQGQVGVLRAPGDERGAVEPPEQLPGGRERYSASDSGQVPGRRARSAMSMNSSGIGPGRGEAWRESARSAGRVLVRFASSPTTGTRQR